MQLRDLQERQAKLADDIKKLADTAGEDGTTWSDETEAHWAALNTEYDQRKVQMDRQLRVETLQGDLSRLDEDAPLTVQARRDPDKDNFLRRQDPKHVTEEDRCVALQAWCLTQCGKRLSEKQQRAAERVGIDPRDVEFDVDLRSDPWNVRHEWQMRQRGEYRMDTTATSGGEYIPEGFVNSLEMSLLAFGGVRQVADVIRTTTGNDLPWPTTNDTGNAGQLLTEAGAVSVQDVTTAAVTFQAFKYSSDVVKISSELMTDSAFNLVAVLGNMLGERIARILNTQFTTGTGSSQPNGIVTASALGVTTALAAAITWDEIIDLEASVDPAYRNRGAGFNAGYMMHDGVALYVRKLKDGDGNYLWSRNATAGVPDTISGFPVTINQDMQATVATATKTIIFGAFGKYKIRDVAGVRLKRLVELYAANDQEGFVAFSRHDGDLLDSGTNPVNHMLQA